MAEGPAQAVGTDDARGHPVLPGDCQLFTGCPQERRGRCWGACLGTAWACPGEVWACPRRAGHVQVGCGCVQGGRGAGSGQTSLKRPHFNTRDPSKRNCLLSEVNFTQTYIQEHKF